MIWVGLIICVYLVKKRTNITLFSPLVLFYLFFLSSILLSILYHYYMPKDWKFNIANSDMINDEDFWTVTKIFVKMIIYFSIGVIIYKSVFNIKKNKNSKVDIEIKLPVIKTSNLVLASIVIIAIDIILVASLYGREIFIRDRYDVDYNKIGLMLLEYSLLFLMFLGSFLYKKRKDVSFFIVFFVTILCIGFGSRMATIYLIVYFFLAYILYMNKTEKFLIRLFGIPFIILFFGYNLSLRYSEYHGIGPYLYLPFLDPSQIIRNSFFNIYYTIIFGLFAAFNTLSRNTVNYDYLLTSLNPAPGFLTDWYLIFRDLRIHPAVPFTGIGEIFTYPTVAFFFYVFVGYFFAHSEKVIQALFSKKKVLLGFVLFLLTAAFIPYSFEYNLRSSVRFIYYAMFFIVIQKFLSKIRIKI